MQDFPTWYSQLQKPNWTPDASIIGTIWTILYPIIFFVYGSALLLVSRGQLPRSLAVIIVLNLIANFAFTPVQFGLRNLPLASVVILVVLTTAVASAVQLFPTHRGLAYALIPYILWVSIASVLQLSIMWMNR